MESNLTKWVLGICSACIVGFMGWVGTTLIRLENTVTKIGTAQLYEMQNAWEHINGNEAEIKKLKDAFYAHDLIARKEDEEEEK